MSLIRFEIRYGDGRKEIAHVDGERALIGHGGHCDIRLPLDQAANEHVAVEVVGSTVRVETKASQPSATVNGLPFTSMPISSDVALVVGSTRIFIALGEAGRADLPMAQKEKQETSPLIKVLGLVGLAAAAYMYLSDDDPRAPVAPVQAPDLFQAPEAHCPLPAPDQARAFATDQREVADANRERSPFVPRDGVEAVHQYETADLCFRQAGASDAANDAARAAKDLRAAIVLDFRARRVRLEHLMAVHDYELARNDISILRSLTQGREGPWVSWLAAADRATKQSGSHE